ncbi:hypothetical protein [Synechocystis sp. CACIAM 05]|uniref:hypothetical protein n=1 Tax=Synechocystis sp. CACIAM 05 TaxID=1933929 RepID=UPI0013915FD0|nr:hypothetical protein [Synechocystis sp. CACIAM 05]
MVIAAPNPREPSVTSATSLTSVVVMMTSSTSCMGEIFDLSLLCDHFADGIGNHRLPPDCLSVASPFKNNVTGIEAAHHLAVTVDGFRRKAESGHCCLPLAFGDSNSLYVASENGGKSGGDIVWRIICCAVQFDDAFALYRRGI